MQEDEMMVTEAARRLGVSKFRIHAMIRQGQIGAEKRVSEVGTAFLVLKVADVERLAEERRRMAAGEIPSRGTRPKSPPPPEGQE